MQRSSAVTAIGLGFLLLTPLSADSWKDALKKAAEQLKKPKQTEVAAAPAAPPAPAPQAGAQSAKDAPKTAAATDKPAEPLPDFAVDPEVVTAQQEEFRKHCVESLWPSKGINCDCAASNYPAMRLLSLQERIKSLEDRKPIACRDTSGPSCAKYLKQHATLMDPEYQKKYKPESSSIDFKLSKVPACQDPTGPAEEAEKTCLQQGKSGMLAMLLPPGQSTTAYCGCVKEGILKGANDPRTECIKR